MKKKLQSRFFIDAHCFDLAAATARCDEPRLSHQIRNVLRLKAGDQVNLLDGLGHMFEAEILSLGRTFIEFAISDKSAADGEGNDKLLTLTSCLPLIKPQRFEWALEKLSELGAERIIPFQSERCLVKAGSGKGETKNAESGRSSRWSTICKEASEQCERLYLPQLLEPLTLADLLDKLGTETAQIATSNPLKLLLSERDAKAPDMVSTLYNRLAAAKLSGQRQEVIVLSGPEGGFAPEELLSIATTGFLPVSLGDHILRSETASILAAGLVSAVNEKKTKEN